MSNDLQSLRENSFENNLQYEKTVLQYLFWTAKLGWLNKI